MQIDFTWRDLISVVSLVTGALSYRWGVKQANQAQDAKQAEERVRKELYRSQVTQKISQLSASIMKVNTTVKSDEFDYASQAAWELISDTAHVVGFCNQELAEGERTALLLMRDDCSKIAAILSLAPDQGPDRADRAMIAKTCLDGLMLVRSLQGRLENIGESPVPVRALRTKP